MLKPAMLYKDELEKKMTLDETIKHITEMAREQEYATKYNASKVNDGMGVLYKHEAERCAEFASEYRQIAEWLTELKEYKRLYEDKWFETHNWLKHMRNDIPKEVIFKDVFADSVNRKCIDDIIKEIIQISDEESKEDSKWALGLRYAIQIIKKHIEGIYEHI